MKTLIGLTLVLLLGGCVSFEESLKRENERYFEHIKQQQAQEEERRHRLMEQWAEQRRRELELCPPERRYFPGGRADLGICLGANRNPIVPSTPIPYDPPQKEWRCETEHYFDSSVTTCRER